MLICENIHKSFKGHSGKIKVLNGINLEVDLGERLGILGYNGAGKSTLLKIISGIETPDKGRVTRHMSLSWPLAFSGAFQGSLSGLDNLRFICRIYGIDYFYAREFVDDFAQLGSKLLEPVKNYSSGMRARLAFSLSMVIDFDCYLIDEVIMVGDSRFTEKCKKELMEKKENRGLILVSHNESLVKEFCTTGAILNDGIIDKFKNIEDALKEYRKLS